MTETPSERPEQASADALAGAEEDSEPRRVYLRFRRVFGSYDSRPRTSRKTGKAAAAGSVPFGEGRDPLALGEAVESLTEQLGWASQLDRSELLASWAEIAGAEIAAHSHPVGIHEGILTVRCGSTAWATQLRMMREQVLSRIAERFPEAGIDAVRFQGPDAPSWKRGPRAIPGRGPRDTYG